MRAVGLRGKTPRRWRKTTVPDPAATVPLDLVRRDFAVDAAQINTRWCGDITYINTPGRAGCTWPPSSTSAPRWSSGTPWPTISAPT